MKGRSDALQNFLKISPSIIRESLVENLNPKKWSSPVQFFFAYAFSLLGLLILYRIAFLLVYGYRIEEGTSFGQVLLTWVYGFRFDLSSIAIFLGSFLIIGLMHPLNKFAPYRALWRYFPLPVMFLCTALLVADVLYYENANKHLGYEAYAYMNKELFVIIYSALVNSPLTVIGGFIFLFGIIGSGVYFVRKIPYFHTSISLSQGIVRFAIGIALVFLTIRGGPQVSPLRVTDAVKFENDFLNVLIVNSLYTVLSDAKREAIPKYQKMDPNIARELVRDVIAYPGAKFISDEYPLLREVPQTSSQRPPNIVFIVLEGWTGKYISPITDGNVNGKEVTPFFNKLNKTGLFFTKMFAAGGRTTNGLMALMGGIPDRPGLTAVRTPQIMNRFSGLPQVLEEMGYQRIFVSGNDLSFNNKGTIMRHWGADEQIGKKQIDRMKRFNIGAWGYFDRDVYTLLHERLLEVTQETGPIFTVLHTITTHYPYRTPDKKFDIFDENTQDYEYLNVLHYADWALNEFLKEAKNAPYFRDTIFVMISDHSHHRYLNYYEDRNVPFLIYAPGRIPGELRREIVSHLDVFPTVVGLTGKKAVFTAMGKDLRQSKGGSAYYAYGDLFGWIEGDMFFIQKVDSSDEGDSWLADAPFSRTMLCYETPIECKHHKDRAKAFLNYSYYLLDSNRIFPDESFFSPSETKAKEGK